MSLIAVFSFTMAWSRFAIDEPVRYASQLRPGAYVCSSAMLIGLLILSMSRRSAAAQLAFATAVSNASTASACFAGSGSWIIPSVRST